MEQHGHIPSGTNEWTLVEAHTPPVPAATSRAAFFVDVKGGEGCLWIDDLDLWQEQGAP
jgi:hypothetical protein